MHRARIRWDQDSPGSAYRKKGPEIFTSSASDSFPQKPSSASGCATPAYARRHTCYCSGRSSRRRPQGRIRSRFVPSYRWMTCHLRSFSDDIWLNCSLTRTMSLAPCSALRRKPAPPVTMLRLTAVPTRQSFLKVSLSAMVGSAATTGQQRLLRQSGRRVHTKVSLVIFEEIKICVF